jgi:undecaprenyl-diphosphatase
VDSLWEVILLGIIEGLTEFLPISSTGHLLIAQHWLGRRSDLFTIAIQSGAILAVSLVYWRRIWALGTRFREPQNRDYVFKLATAFLITAAGGMTAKLLGFELPESVVPIAWALIIGGFVIFGAEAYASRQEPREQVTWKVAIAVGAAQVVAAIFPGASRSASAIFAGIFAGLTSRPAAAEFAFLVGIPTMFAATGYQFLDVAFEGKLADENWMELGVAFLVSAAVGFLAVRWLLGYLQNHTYKVFAWYRIAFGVLLLVVLSGAGD